MPCQPLSAPPVAHFCTRADLPAVRAEDEDDDLDEIEEIVEPVQPVEPIDDFDEDDFDDEFDDDFEEDFEDDDFNVEVREDELAEDDDGFDED